MLEINFREHWKTIVLIVAGATLLALIITLSSVAISNARRRRAERESEAALAAEQALLPSFILDELEARRENLMLSPSIEEFRLGDYEPLYPLRRQWGMDDLRRYLYDPRQIGSESLRDVNRELLDDFLNEYR